MAPAIEAEQEKPVENRLFNDVITLRAGEYRVYYETDGSHSYRDWNSSPPDDVEKYGITIMNEK